MRVRRNVQLAAAAVTMSALLAGCGSVGGSGEGGAVGDENLKAEGHDDGHGRQVEGHRLVRPDGGGRQVLRQAHRRRRPPGGRRRREPGEADPDHPGPDPPAARPPSPWCPTRPRRSQTCSAQARDQGIVVVSHEATGIENVDIDIEAFDNAAYGEQIMDSLAECMGEKGKYVQFVGGLTAKTHMEWVGAAYDKQTGRVPRHDPRRGPDREQRQRGRRLPQGQGAPGEVPRTSRASRAPPATTSPASPARSRRPAWRTRSA